MRKLIIVLILIPVISLVWTFGFAMKHTAEERGHTLFNDQKFAGGEKACNECHPNGKGLQMAGDKKEFDMMGKKLLSLEEAVNTCIVNGNKGKAIDVHSEQMKDIVAYIKSLKPKKTETGGYK